MKKTILKTLLIYSLLTSSLFASNNLFRQGGAEFGISELGIGYSSATGLLFAGHAQYQYFVLNRLSVGGGVFYRNLAGRDSRFEHFGAGPAATYYFWTTTRWFAGIGQNLVFSRYHGRRSNMSLITTTSSLGLNYLVGERSALGVVVAYSHALDDRRLLYPFSVGAAFRTFF
jgi:hypothetical protein